MIPIQQLQLLQGPTVVSVDTGSKTLAALGMTVANFTRGRVAFIPAASGIYFARGTASAGSAPIPVGGIDFYVTYQQLLEFQFYASTIAMTVMIFSP